MLRDIDLRLEGARTLAQGAMQRAAVEGISIGSWRDDVVEIFEELGLEVPEDMLAWISGGKASDADVGDWGAAFSLT